MSEDMASEDLAGPDILGSSVDALNLSSASATTLRGHYIQTVGDLIQKMEGELLSFGLSRDALFEVKEALGNAGLSLGLRFDENGMVITPTGALAPSDILSSPVHGEQIGLFEEADPPILTQAPSPPKPAAYLLYLFLSKHDRENIPGDLAEEYETIIVPEFGLRKAKLWY